MGNSGWSLKRNQLHIRISRKDIITRGRADANDGLHGKADANREKTRTKIAGTKRIVAGRNHNRQKFVNEAARVKRCTDRTTAGSHASGGICWRDGKRTEGASSDFLSSRQWNPFVGRAAGRAARRAVYHATCCDAGRVNAVPHKPLGLRLISPSI